MIGYETWRFSHHWLLAGSTAKSDECILWIVIVDRLVGWWGDMKCQNLMSIYMIEHALGIDWLIELLRTQGAQEVLFQLLCIVNSWYFKLLAILLYSKHYPSAGSVGECTYGFPYILREFALGLLASKSSHSMSLILSISSSFVMIMMIKLKYRISSSLHFKK